MLILPCIIEHPFLMTKFKNSLAFTLVALLFTVLSINSFAQDIDWGQLQHADDKDFYPRLVGDDESRFYTYRFLEGNCYLEAFRKNDMQLDYSELIEPGKIEGNKAAIRKVSFIGDQYIVFKTYYSKSTKETKIIGQSIDATTLESSKPVEFFSVEVEKKKRQGKFYIWVSPDRSRILLNHYAYYKEYREYRDKYKLIDRNLNVLVEREDVFDKGERDYSTSDYRLDNNGSFYFRKQYDEYRTSIVCYEAQRNYREWERPIKTGDLGMADDSYITHTVFSINKNNDLIITGYYTEGDNKFDGCFYLRLDSESHKIVSSKLNKFSQDFKDEFITERNLFDEKPEFNNDFGNMSIYHKADGGIVLVGERFKWYQIRSRNSVTNYYTYGDLVVLNMNNQGELVWSNRIPKPQKYDDGIGSLLSKDTRTTDYYSYLAGFDNEKMVILYNDHLKNTLNQNEQGRLKALKNVNNAQVTMYSIDMRSGAKSKTLFPAARDTEVLLMPSTYYQRNQDSPVIVFGRKHKKYKFGVLTL